MNPFDPLLTEDRRQRNIRYVVVCASVDPTEIWAEISVDTEDNCVVAAKHWAKLFKGNTFCYCVQNGELGGRPFAGFYTNIDQCVKAYKNEPSV